MIEIVNATAKVDVAEAKAAGATVQQAVSNLGTVTDPSNTGSAVDAISQIGEIAATRNLPGVTEQAAIELKSISTAPNMSDDTKARARVALERLERASSTALLPGLVVK